MRTPSTILAGIALSMLGTIACKKNEKSAEAKPEAKADKPAEKPAAKAGPRTCADYGATNKGDFFDPCKIEGPPPFEIKFTGRYHKNAFDEEVPVIAVTSKADHDMTWATLHLYYYDAAGNLLEHTGQDGSKFKDWYISGGGFFTVKAGATTEIHVGANKAKEPAGVASIEPELSGWGWDNGENDKLYFSGNDHVTDWSTRPKGGWK